MRYWTYYWNEDQILRAFDRVAQDGVAYPVDYTGGSGFRKRGVASGDALYIVNWLDGKLRVLGRMIVDAVLDRPAALAKLGEVFDAPEHVVARPGLATLQVFDADVDDSDVEVMDMIEFIDAMGSRSGPKRNPAGGVEPQTFRNVREVTEETAELFDSLLGFEIDRVFGDEVPVQRAAGFEFLCRDDGGNQVAVVADLMASSEVLLDRWIEESVSVTDGSLLSDPDQLAPLLWECVTQWCDATGAVIVDGGIPFAQQVRDSIESSKVSYE